jgi:hypothetical protein
LRFSNRFFRVGHPGPGSTAVVLKQESGWTYGGLTNHLWSVDESENDPDVNATFLQPFLAYTTETQVTYVLNSESTCDFVELHESRSSSLARSLIRRIQVEFDYLNKVSDGDSPNAFL